MIIFHTDLDNTLIYSYRHDIGENKRSVELYQGREISYISDRTFSLLREIKKSILVVPTSTRTIEQYKRINLGVGPFEYALVCNGGVLLVNGEKDDRWYRETLKITEESTDELNKALQILDRDARRIFGLRFIENLFVFTKCDFPENVADDLKKELDTSVVNVFSNGSKVYVLPKNLDKGTAVMRFREYIRSFFQDPLPEDSEAEIGSAFAGTFAERESDGELIPDADTERPLTAGGGSYLRPGIIAAGDSEFDVSMLEAADKGFAPHGFIKKYRADDRILEMDEKKLFSEAVLEECLKIIREKP